MNTIVVNVTEEDFKNGDYVDPRGCALALALLREGHKLGGRTLGVGPSDVEVNDATYGILETTEVQQYHDYPKDLTVHLLKL